MTALVTSCYGGYDQVADLPLGHGFSDAVLVTDDPAARPRGWRVVVLPSPEPPRLAAKAAKCLPWLFTPEPQSLWLDASFAVVSLQLSATTDEHLERSDVVAWKHPSGRSDLFQEAEFSASVSKYASQPLAAQAWSYRAAGVCSGSGLWEVGMLARRHTELVRRHGALWYGEIMEWSIQDQVSFPYACWKLGVDVEPWAFPDRWSFGQAQWRPHRDES